MDIRSNTRRNMACQRFVQKSAKDVAENGLSNIGGQQEGDEPKATANMETIAYMVVIDRAVTAQTDKENSNCSWISNRVIGSSTERSQTRPLLNVSKMS